MAGNPYELRQGLLEQAKQILEHRYHCTVQKCKDKGVACNAEPPSTEEIIAEAEKLYAFVQKK